MKYFRNALRFLIVLYISTVMTLTLTSNRLFYSVISEGETEQLALMRSILMFNLQGAENRALARAAMIADLPRTRTLLAAQDRPALLAEFQTMFSEQKEKYGVDQAQFHLPPAMSFLRFQDPEHFGDDLAKFRPMVVAANKDQIPHKGFAIARSGPAIFGVVPVFDLQNRHIGSFEVGMAFANVLDSLKLAHDLDLAIFVDERPLREFALGVNPGVFSEQNRVGKYIRYHATNRTLFDQLIKESDLILRESGSFSRDTVYSTYGVVSIPLRNAANEPQAILVAAKDFRGLQAIKHRSTVWQILMAVLAIVGMAGLTLVVVRGVLLRPLASITAAFVQLAGGKPSAKIPDTEQFCAELKELAEQHEKLRAAADDIQKALANETETSANETETSANDRQDAS